MDVSSEVRLIADKHLVGIKSSGPDQIMAFCPFHDNKNTPAFTMNLSSGLYHCFSCGESGNLQMFLKKVGITWNVIQRQYKDVIDATRSAGKKKVSDPFVELRGMRTSLSRREFLGSSITSSRTSGRSTRAWM